VRLVLRPRDIEALDAAGVALLDVDAPSAATADRLVTALGSVVGIESAWGVEAPEVGAGAAGAVRAPFADAGSADLAAAVRGLAELLPAEVRLRERAAADAAMRLIGGTQSGVVYAVVAGAHRIVVSDAGEAPRPGPQRVATPMGRPGTAVFIVSSAADERQGLLLDDSKPYAVTFGPGLKTAEASGTFLDVQDGATMVPYAVTVRFACRP
jgi:hypothetical protein